MSTPATDPLVDLADLQRTPRPGAALALYDALPAVDVADVLGDWRGESLPTGHPMDGVLERFGWHGKRFRGPDDVDPLVFRGRAGLVRVDPARLPLSLLTRAPWLPRLPVTAPAFRLALPLLRTGAPRARLRRVEHRGVVTAAMVYDDQPVVDAFRAVDADTLLGVMDWRGDPGTFLFVLRRDTTD